MSQLTHFHCLSSPEMFDPLGLVVAASQSWRDLTRLSLGSAGGGVILHPERLLRGSARHSLTTLALRDVNLEGEGLGHLLDYLPAKGLEELHLSGCGLGPEGVARLAAAETLSDLRTLSLAGDILGDVGVRALAGSPHLRQLTALRLNRVGHGREGTTPLSAAGVEALAHSPIARQLRSLDLRGNHLQDDEIEPLLGASALGQLTTLAISWGTVRWDSASEAMLRRLSASPALPHLSLAFLEGKWMSLDGGAVRPFPRGISPLPPPDAWAPWEATPSAG